MSLAQTPRAMAELELGTPPAPTAGSRPHLRLPACAVAAGSFGAFSVTLRPSQAS